MAEKNLQALRHEQPTSLEQAAEPLAHAYRTNAGLTAFTSLDGPVFRKQSDCWLVNLDPTVGSEIRKVRPAIIVDDDCLGKLPMKVIGPLTAWKPAYSQAAWMVRVLPAAENKLLKESAAGGAQLPAYAALRPWAVLLVLAALVQDQTYNG